jgi:uncharacterized protein YjbI with pentapeptide repeats
MPFRTLKPFQLGVFFRVVERQRSIHGCFSLLTMSLRAGAPLLKSEPSLWKSLAQHAPEFVETGVTKSQPEFLVFGHAHAYDGAAESAVGIRFGGVEKWCRVVGPRRYPDAMKPAPFERVRLDWRHAYGGPDFPANPLGMGRARDEAGRIVLPHFEASGMPWRPDDRPLVPAGFGPLDITHPDRQKLVGTYNEEWLKTDFPGMARDADWHFFQVAPPDQWLREELRGDEPFDLAGLHPTERVQHGRLPGLRPRLFVERRQERLLSELRLRLRTVVFLADADAVLQIWQGFTRLEDEDASELTHVLAGLDTLESPRPESHYASVFARRLDEEDGALAMLRDEDLLPEGITFESLVPADTDLNRLPAADSLEGRLEKKALRQIEDARAIAASHGLDPDEHAPPLPGPRETFPPLHLLGDYLRRQDAMAERQMRAAEDGKREMLEKMSAEFAARGESFEHVIEEVASGPTGPPRPTAPGLLAGLQGMSARLLANNTRVDEIEAMLTDAELQERWHAADRAVQGMYQESAHLQNPAPRSEGPRAEAQKRWVAERLATGRPLAGFDLTGADLREFDLRGANLDGALMESVCLDGVNLAGASARTAVLAHASLEKAQADDCDFSKANLGKARLLGATACGANFEGAILWESDFTGAALRHARLTDVQAMHVKLAGADLSEAVVDDLLLYQTDLTGVRLANASMKGTQFLENRLDGADFSGVQGHGAVFLKPNAEGLRFDGADLTGAVFVQEPKLARASMRSARLTRVFARGADLTGADFSGANLDGCELGEAVLHGTTLRGVQAREAGLRFADLTGAEVIGADLRGSLLGNATVFGARFDRSSLFMTDLGRLRTDTKSTFERVNFGRARLHPRWEPPKGERTE